MALIKCKKCGHKATVGFMPTASCGALVIGGSIIGGAIGLSIVNPMIQGLPIWWKLAIWPISLAISGVIGMMLLHLIPWTFEWIFAMCHCCPKCGARKWSFPFTEGFGL